MRAETTAKAPGQITYVLFAAFLILHFLGRILLPFGEWTVGFVHWWHVGFDLLAVPVLLAMRKRLIDARGEVGPAARSAVLFWAALAAGAAALLVRVSSNAAWWT